MNRTKTTLILAFLTLPLFAQPFMPEDHRQLTKTISYGEMETFLKSVDGKGAVKVSVEGQSTHGRSIYLVRLAKTEKPAWKILFYAQQHGDEISGKDAALYLIRDIARDPAKLPADTAVWIMPMMNPDGAEAGTRVNGAGVDINRDHMTLDQPETQALHRVVQRVLPDIAVDCHEFARGGESWKKRGWEKWPDITLDRLNNPMFHPSVFSAGDRWLARAATVQKAAGHPFLRYSVGGVPPDEEQRHSAPDIDSGMNAIGTYGGLSFIIEAAARKENIPNELGNRVDAYLAMLRMFVEGDGNRKYDATTLAASRARSMPAFIPTNYLWVNPAGTVTKFPVRSLADGSTVEVPTPNLMTDLAVKRSVARPLGYAIEARAADQFATLLARHAIPFERITEPNTVALQTCTLVRVEDEFDEIYARYEGRQIVKCAEAARRELGAGMLYVPLTRASAIRASLLLEPQAMYGLYQYPAYRNLAAEGGALPVVRVLP